MNPYSQVQFEALRHRGVTQHRAGDLERALATYDEARALAHDEEALELVTINKADVLIDLDRSGPEVTALPAILMRRRNARHTFLAAYQLAFKNRIDRRPQRAMSYIEIAQRTAIESGNAFWEAGALNERGLTCETESKFAEAIACFEKALTLLDLIDNPEERESIRISSLHNLGFNKLVLGKTNEGLGIIHDVIDQTGNRRSNADSYIELCYGYLEKHEYDRAIAYGERGLELAGEERQNRNAHYLLGEAAQKAGRTELAELHFAELAARFPEFRNLKSLLFAIDLRSMINLHV
jgi:tetratricopeptide (TPR) repeat protein